MVGLMDKVAMQVLSERKKASFLLRTARWCQSVILPSDRGAFSSSGLPQECQLVRSRSGSSARRQFSDEIDLTQTALRCAAVS